MIIIIFLAICCY